MNLNKSSIARNVVISLFTALIAIPGVASASALTVTQGDEILSPPGGDSPIWTSCTVGYVDNDARQFHTASHCLNTNQVFSQDGSHIGDVMAQGANTRPGNDIAIVKLSPGVHPGGNPHSGDVAVDTSDVYKGDPICTYGDASGNVRCGRVVSKDKETVTGNRATYPINGDSGGPAWIPGKGYVGVASRHYNDARSGEKLYGQWSKTHEMAHSVGGSVPVNNISPTPKTNIPVIDDFVSSSTQMLSAPPIHVPSHGEIMNQVATTIDGLGIPGLHSGIVLSH